tara:strand:+ start:505 stop:666 length:162 start_codon:yes stop_codon:yes gene_type:complete
MLGNSKKLEDILNIDKKDILIKSKGGRYSSILYEINLKKFYYLYGNPNNNKKL